MTRYTLDHATGRQGTQRERVVSTHVPVLPRIIEHDSYDKEIDELAALVCNSEGTPIVMLSGCSWHCSGGGQRPVQLSREWSRKGHVVLYSCIPMETRWLHEGNVTVVPHTVLSQVVKRLCTLDRQGVVIATYGHYAPQATALWYAGWQLIYDLLDDWDAFATMGEIYPGSLEQEPELIKIAGVVTCSAEALLRRAQRLGARRTVLIRNAGPSLPFSKGLPPPNLLVGREATLIYSGYLQGQWFDWSALAALAVSNPQWAINVIGAYQNVPAWPNVHFHGELPYAEAMRYLPHCDAGLIPFRNEAICRSVDPIKYYDYLAAGLPTVATNVMSDLQGRPHVYLCPPEDLASGVHAALAAEHIPDESIPELLEQNSWTLRASAMLGTVSGKLISPESASLRVSWQAPASCNMVPPCPYCSTIGGRQGKSALPQDPATILKGFRCLASEHGPLYLSACYGEPMGDRKTRQILGVLALTNKIDIVTNALFDLTTLNDLPANGNVAFATSFHPHAWPSLADFIRKRQAIASAGFTCGMCEICAYPDYLPHLEGWRKELLAAGIPTSFLPFQGWHRGKPYPKSYTKAEQALVSNVVAENYTGDLALGFGASPRGRLCDAGHTYLYVAWSGEVQRCCIPGTSLGTVYPEYQLSLQSSATPCKLDACPCPDLWRYVHDLAIL